jgi:hypothetical protein
MMQLMLIMLGPPIVTWLIFVMIPTDRSYKIALAVFGVLWIACAFAVYPQPSVEDDWFAGAELIPFWGMFLAVVAVTAARFVANRRAENDQAPQFGPLLAVLTIVPPAAIIFFFKV